MNKQFDRSTRAGFTLVELIVVIAILAILAGVAIPVYSNYVTKAQKAADETLLAAVNTAAAAAVLEVDGEDMAQKGPDDLHFAIGIMNLEEIRFKESFKKFFEGNGGFSPAVKGLIFENGVFIFDENARGVLVSGYSWTGNTAAVAAAYNASNWKELGVDGVTTTVDYVANALQVYGNMRNVLKNARGFEDVLAEMGIEDFDSADNATLANATVFYVADRLKNVDASALQTALLQDKIASAQAGGDSVSTNLDAYLGTLGISASENQKEYQLVNAALKYAIATSYVYSGLDNNLKDSITGAALTDYGTVMDLYKQAQNSSGYVAYLTRDAQGNNGVIADVNAFTQILGSLDANTAAFADIEGSNLFSDPEVRALINDILSSTGDNN